MSGVILPVFGCLRRRQMAWQRCLERRKTSKKKNFWRFSAIGFIYFRMYWKMEGGDMPKDETKEIKRVYRSKKNKMLAGVCGGIAEYFEVDPVLVRLLFVLLLFMGFVGIIIYLVAWLLIPENLN